MKKLMNFLKTTIIGGLFFLIPLFVVIIIAGKIWQKMSGVGPKLAALIGVKSIGGVPMGPVLTSFTILAICFVSGLLFKLSWFHRFRVWLDDLLIKYIPGYEFYKTTLEQKISKEDAQHPRPTAIVTMDNIGQACIIVEALEDARLVVFIPFKPGTAEGHVYVVPDASVTRLTIDEKALNKLLMNQGKGLSKVLAS